MLAARASSRICASLRRLLHSSTPKPCAPEFLEMVDERPDLKPTLSKREWPLDLRGMEIRTAKARRLGINTSPQKLNLVAKLVRNLRIEEARRQLAGCKKKTAPYVAATIHAAVKNAKAFNLREDRLVVEEAFVGKGRYLPRIRPWHGKGRWGLEHKKYAHLTIKLRELDEELWENRVMSKYFHLRRGNGRPDDENHPIHSSTKVSWVSDLDDSFRKTRERIEGLKELVKIGEENVHSA
ncbi:Ribosomal protein L22/L17 [Gracilaria domingensis]|nr:Ribosomal protein L22/L17 [Gracilaria domingensis]